MLPVFLDCLLLIAPLVFSNLRPVSCVPNVVIVSGLSILDCPFGFLWIVYSWLPLWFSLDCLFLISPLIFSELSILDCPFDFVWIVYSWFPRWVSLDCLFLIAPLVFSGLSILILPLWFSLTFIFYYNKCEHRNVLSKRQVWMSILIGYYTVVCTIWKDIVRVCIVLKTRIGRDAAGIESNTGFQYNTDEYNIFPYCTYHCIINYLLYSWNDQYYVMFNF